MADNECLLSASPAGIAVHGKRPGSQREEVEGTPSTRQRESGEIGLEKGSWEAENTCRYSSPEKMEGRWMVVLSVLYS